MQVCIEAIFLEAALAVLQRGGGPLALSERQGSTLEGFAFDWIVSADRYIETKHSELMKCRARVRCDVRLASRHLSFSISTSGTIK